MTNKILSELKDIMDDGISHWGEPMERYKREFAMYAPSGFEVAADVVKAAIRTYGKYHRNIGGVSYHSISLKTQITHDDIQFFGFYPVVEIRVDYYGSIVGFNEKGNGVGGKHLLSDVLRVVMDRIIETVER